MHSNDGFKSIEDFETYVNLCIEMFILLNDRQKTILSNDGELCCYVWHHSIQR